jgi:tRNA-dihydrouridine synthase 3
MTPQVLSSMHGKMILAPLTRGGNLPFRRLCADFGCDVAVGEMVFARYLIKGDHRETARLRRAPNEKIFGVQIATNEVEEGVRAVSLAADAGADWVDLNCGCPIYEATRRGLGSALLRRPDKLASLVRGISDQSALPLSVKVRIAPEGRDVNVREVVDLLRDAGAAAVTIHGRTAEQRCA